MPALRARPDVLPWPGVAVSFFFPLVAQARRGKRALLASPRTRMPPPGPASLMPAPIRCERRAGPWNFARDGIVAACSAALKELADDRDHSDHQQQKLFLLVAARLAALQNGRIGICRGGSAGRRPEQPSRVVAAGAVDPRAVPHSSGHQNLGYS